MDSAVSKVWKALKWQYLRTFFVLMCLTCHFWCNHTESPTQNPFNRTLSPARRDELAKIRQRQLANAVHYIWETGEDKFAFRYFHTGFWESCEKHNDGEATKHVFDLLLSPSVVQHLTLFLSSFIFCSFFRVALAGEVCRSFIDLTPGETQGASLINWILCCASC